MVSPTPTLSPPADAHPYGRPGGPSSGASSRPLGRRPSLPSGRAAIGAFLVIASASLVFAAFLAMNRPPTQTYVVAARDLVAYQKVTAADFTLVTGELSPEAARNVFASPQQLQDAVMLVSVGQGSLMTGSVVQAANRPTALMPNLEFAFDIAPNQFTGLRPGDWIDVFVKPKSKGDGNVSLTVNGTSIAAASDISTDEIRFVARLRIVALPGTTNTVTVALASPQEEFLVVGALFQNPPTIARVTRGTELGADGKPLAPVVAPPDAATGTTTTRATPTSSAPPTTGPAFFAPPSTEPPPTTTSKSTTTRASAETTRRP